jgi:hypothetical protein
LAKIQEQELVLCRNIIEKTDESATAYRFCTKYSGGFVFLPGRYAIPFSLRGALSGLKRCMPSPLRGSREFGGLFKSKNEV